ncbi:MAG: helix-turn-helix transcriptional regulator [Clostridiales bacterium]|nr:helix-turn-helix transcriptional regulator [Clostridiales bacterium]
MLKLCQCGYFRSKNVFSENVTPLREVELFEMEIIQVGTGFSYIDGISYPHIPNRLILARPGNQRFTIGTFEARFVKFSCADPHVLQLLQALPPTTILSDGRLKALMADIAHGEETPGAARYFAQQSALCALIAEAAAQLQQEPLTAPAQEILSPDILGVKEYIDQHFDEKLDLEKLAAIAHLSRNFFRLKFQTVLGISPHEYLAQVRLTYAKKLLASTQCPLSEIAISCGYESQAYMNYVFKRQTGQTPLSYRKKKQSR